MRALRPGRFAQSCHDSWTHARNALAPFADKAEADFDAQLDDGIARLLPVLGLGFAVLTLVRWMNAAPLPHDTDHHAMAIIGIVIVLALSFICLIVGVIVSLVTTTIARMR